MSRPPLSPLSRHHSRSFALALLFPLVLVLTLAAALAAPLFAPASAAAATAVSRPPIVGVAHIGLHTADLAKDQAFYGGVLGFAQPFTVNKPGGGLMLTYFKVNDHQYIEVFPDLAGPTADRLSHIAFETTNIRQLRDYLAARGVAVPATLKKGLDGNISFMVKDPDGHNVEFVQYMPGSLHTTHFGRDLPARRISCHILHVGITVRDRAAADRFYKDILGFREVWRGGMTDQRTQWVDMQVPNGGDWLEYMLIGHRTPGVRELGVLHHLALSETNVRAAYKELMRRGLSADGKALPNGQPPQIGRDGKWQANLYDPDGTRVELMNPVPSRPPCCAPFTGRSARHPPRCPDLHWGAAPRAARLGAAPADPRQRCVS